MTRAVLFDLDGTLLDTLPDIHFVLNETLKRFSYPQLTVKQTLAYIGEGAFRLVERALPPHADNIQAFFEEFKNVYARTRTRAYSTGSTVCLSGSKHRA